MPKPISKKRRASSILRGGRVAVDSEGNAMFTEGDPRNEAELAKSRRPALVAAEPAAEPAAAAVAAKEKKSWWSRPKVVVGTTNVKAAMKRNKKNQMNKIPADIVVINERVQLDETDFVPNEGGNLGFSYEYFPPKNGVIKTPNELIEAKVVFANVFRPNSEFSLINPKPPCDIDEYGILREGLNNRLERIRVQVRAGKRNEGLSIRVRALMEQGVKIKKLLDDMVENVENCGNYQGETQISINKISNLDDDQIRRLIRNFSFLVLQALNPIEGYDDKMAVDPVDLVNVLDNTDFTESDMNDFLKDYQEQYSIPRLIGIILSDTNSQKSMLNLMLEDEKRKLVQTLINSLTSKLEGTSSATAFATFQATIGGEDSNTRITSVIGWVVDEIKRVSYSKGESDAEIVRLKSTEVTLNARLAELETEKSAVTLQLDQAQAESVSLSATPIDPIDKATYDAVKIDKEKNDRAIVKLNEEIVTLQKELETCRAELETTKAGMIKNKEGQKVTQTMFNSLISLLNDTEQNLKDATAKNRSLEDDLRNLQIKKAKCSTMVGELIAKSKSPLSQQERAELQSKIEELNAKANDYDAKIQEINELKVTLEGVTFERDKIRIDSKGLKEELEASQASAGSVQREIEQLKIEISNLKEQNDILKQPVLNKGETLITQIKEIEKKEGDNKTKIDNSSTEIETTIALLPTMDAKSQSTKQNEIAALRLEIDKLTEINSKLATTKNKLEEELNRISGATNNDSIKQAELLAQKEAQVASLERTLVELNGKIAKNNVITANKDVQVGEATSAESALRERVRKLAEALQNEDSDALLPFTNDSQTGFSELVKVVAEKTKKSNIKSDSTDICYLNYFVSFFIRELFFTSINEQVQSNKVEIIKDVDTIKDSKSLLELIFTTLKSNEYEITDENLRNFLKGHANISKNLEEIYMFRFPDFHKNVRDIKYTISGSRNPLTPLASLGNKTTLTYLTLFTYFLFIARKYLLDNKDKITGCGNNIFIENKEGSARSSNEPVTVVNTVASDETAPTVAPIVIPTVAEPVAKVLEDIPVKNPDDTIRKLIIEASKSPNSAISKGVKDTEIQDQSGKSPVLKNFLRTWQKESKTYTVISDISKKLSDNRTITTIEGIKDVCEDNISKPNNIQIIKKFIIDLMKTYIQVYNINNIPSNEVSKRVNAMLPIFKNNLNPSIKSLKDNTVFIRLFPSSKTSGDTLKNEVENALKNK